jgi:hypothetical protein
VSVTCLLAQSCSIRNGGVAQLQVGSSVMIRPASRTFAFEPEHIQPMHRAFEAVCAKLQLSTASEDRMTELVGEKVIELAQAGEHDADRLAARVLAEFGSRTTDRCGGIRSRVPHRSNHCATPPNSLAPAPLWSRDQCGMSRGGGSAGITAPGPPACEPLTVTMADPGARSGSAISPGAVAEPRGRSGGGAGGRTAFSPASSRGTGVPGHAHFNFASESALCCASAGDGTNRYPLR